MQLGLIVLHPEHASVVLHALAEMFLLVMQSSCLFCSCLQLLM